MCFSSNHQDLKFFMKISIPHVITILYFVFNRFLLSPPVTVTCYIIYPVYSLSVSTSVTDTVIPPETTGTVFDYLTPPLPSPSSVWRCPIPSLPYPPVNLWHTSDEKVPGIYGRKFFSVILTPTFFNTYFLSVNTLPFLTSRRNPIPFLVSLFNLSLWPLPSTLPLRTKESSVFLYLDCSSQSESAPFL